MHYLHDAELTNSLPAEEQRDMFAFILVAYDLANGKERAWTTMTPVTTTLRELKGNLNECAVIHTKHAKHTLE